MEGMVCKEIRAIQLMHSSVTGLRCNTECWERELVTRLLEVTHGQWLYHNVQVHDRIMGTLTTQQKEELQMEIERQQELGTEGLLGDDCYLAECNLGGRPRGYLRYKGDLLVSSHSSHRGSKQTGGNTDSASRNSPQQYLERAYLETTVVWLQGTRAKVLEGE